MPLPDIDSFSAFGGPKNNYSAVVDPTTDEDAANRNQYAANSAMMTWMLPRAMRRFLTVPDANPTDPLSGLVHAATWGASNGVKPTVTRSSEGIWLLAWPVTVASELTSATVAQGGGVMHTLNFRNATAAVEIVDTTFRAAAARVTGPNTVEVRTFLGTTLDDIDGSYVNVWVW